MKQWQLCLELICVLLTLLLARVPGLKLISLKIPSATNVLSTVTLKCEYDLEGRKLYSVKWYKDGSEFFRYMPDYEPEIRAVKSSGINVDLKQSGMNMVTITDLQFNNSGNYKCEVSTEAPNFDTVANSSNMTVMSYPDEDPTIDGVLPTYSIGDHVSANCTSGKSKPVANMTWYINGVEVDSWQEYRQSVDEADPPGFHSMTVGLHFQVHSSHFTNKEERSSRIEIRCTSTLGESIRHKSVYSTLFRTLTSGKLAQERHVNSAGKSVSTSSSIVVLIVTLINVAYSS
ncbi:hypothetical protein L9F63_012270 [Diploptera punctata]|uniref:Ig-like domain-containing protein n=1 Tax=Diploptera punctata TaxID=6984 RepID=A0AAD8ACW3_DIPPU|nr:hypothetical protein L9F63_012270 [Diploptera punctata]